MPQYYVRTLVFWFFFMQCIRVYALQMQFYNEMERREHTNVVHHRVRGALGKLQRIYEVNNLHNLWYLYEHGRETLYKLWKKEVRDVVCMLDNNARMMQTFQLFLAWNLVHALLCMKLRIWCTSEILFYEMKFLFSTFFFCYSKRINLSAFYCVKF